LKASPATPAGTGSLAVFHWDSERALTLSVASLNSDLTREGGKEDCVYIATISCLRAERCTIMSCVSCLVTTEEV
jgi:hypothetical protein